MRAQQGFFEAVNDHMKCHLVYSVPLVGGNLKIASLRRKLSIYLQRKGGKISAIGDRKAADTSRWPEMSPYSITRHLYEGFSSVMPTSLYHLREECRISFEEDDIFIGHPRFPCSPGMKGVTGLALEGGRPPKVAALISPLHCDTGVKTGHINRDYLDSVDFLLPKADILFAIMGEYWWDRWGSSPYAHWKSKMFRLDMAIDVKSFPRVKKEFNPAGKRRFLYIGRNDPMKGIGLLSKLMSENGGYDCGWIGPGDDIPGIKRISGPRSLDTKFMEELAEGYDFFITTGIADPNPTTILESMAWGFPVICTPQSGYYGTSYLRNVFHDDILKSRETLSELQFMDDKGLKKIADEARGVVEEKYNWGRFMGGIRSNLDFILSQKAAGEHV